MSGDGIRRRLLAIQQAVGGGPDYQITLHPDAPGSSAAATLRVGTDALLEPGTIYVLLRRDLPRTPNFLMVMVNSAGTKYSRYTGSFGGTSMTAQTNYTYPGDWTIATGAQWDATQKRYPDTVWDVYELRLED